jgi:DNA-binding NarL/FixJ family response regulator
MRLLASGKSVKEISFDLALSIKTVSTYRTRLLKKLGLTTTADVIRYAVQEGLVE